MRFRPAGPGDVDSVVPLMHESSRDLVDATVGPDLLRRDFLRGRGIFGWRHQLVGVVDGEIAATITAYPGRRYRHLSLHTLRSALIHFGPVGTVKTLRRCAPVRELFAPPSRDAIFLANLCVASSHRGRGYGSRAIAHASMGQPAELDVSASNVGAERLYRRLGFAVAGERTAPGFDSFRRMRR
jgi:GNAT superfamily N-acetyltransferase